MTKEQIKNEAAEYAKGKYGGENAEMWSIAQIHAGRDGFVAGADWRINSVWHKPEEVPAPNKDFFMMIDEESKKTMLWRIYPQHTVDDWLTLIKANCVVRWAYIDDLIPTKDETA